MASSIKIGIWNANGLVKRSQELKTFLINHNIDLMLISEAHFTKKSYLKIPKYSIYATQHPKGTAHGGTAVIIKTAIKHHINKNYEQDYLQATSVTMEDWFGPITVAAIYCPPKHTINKHQYTQFFKTLGYRFIAGGDYNAKHPWWGSRSHTPTPKGRQLYLCMQENNLIPLSTGEPTYWPTDRRKKPDVIDFCVVKGIAATYLNIVSSLDLSSDHSPIIATLNAQVSQKQKSPSLHNKRTNWDTFREILIKDTNYNILLKTKEQLETAVEMLNHQIQKAAWNATPDNEVRDKPMGCSRNVKINIAEKRKLRKQWQHTRSPHDKAKLNKAIKELKKLLEEEKNEAIQAYLQGLTPTEVTDYSLWKATRKVKQPQQFIPPIKLADGSWARTNKEKATIFANHLQTVFQPFPREITEEEEQEIHECLATPDQMELPIKKFKVKEVQDMINNDLNAKKAPGWDLITGRILKELPARVIRIITMLFNAALKLEYFPSQWKVAQIILLPKPGKDPEQVTSYRPISLLPILSKVLEKLLLKRIKPILQERQLIPEHQFGFRERHATIEQVHRVVRKINKDIENQKYCTAVFLDITQAFDKVWHPGLLYKIKQNLPHNIFRILKSYIDERHFLVRYQDEYTDIHTITSGVPQGSVLGPILYILFTSDYPTSRDTTIATFADDTTLIASHRDPRIASRILQTHLYKTQNWLRRWRIKANELKSVQVTFTTKKETCPPVTLNNRLIPQENSAKYLGIHLDRRLTWKTHIWNKRKQLAYKLSKLYWLIGRKSQLTLENKILIYKTVLKPVWSYGVQLWGTASVSNIEILERFQAKVLRMIVDAPWFVTNEIIRRDLRIPTVKEEVKNYSVKYSDRLRVHPNRLAKRLLAEQTDTRRLKRFKPLDLATRFN